MTRELKIFDQDEFILELKNNLDFRYHLLTSTVSSTVGVSNFSELKPNFNVFRYVTLCISYTVDLFLSRFLLI